MNTTRELYAPDFKVHQRGSSFGNATFYSENNSAKTAGSCLIFSFILTRQPFFVFLHEVTNTPQLVHMTCEQHGAPSPETQCYANISRSCWPAVVSTPWMWFHFQHSTLLIRIFTDLVTRCDLSSQIYDHKLLQDHYFVLSSLKRWANLQSCQSSPARRSVTPGDFFFNAVFSPSIVFFFPRHA